MIDKFRKTHPDETVKTMLNQIMQTFPLKIVFVEYFHLVVGVFVFLFNFFDGIYNLVGSLFVATTFVGMAGAIALILAMNEYKYLKSDDFSKMIQLRAAPPPEKE